VAFRRSVTFDIDANGLVNVSAKDKATSKEQQIRIEASGGLSDDEIDRMVNEAESHADDDKQRRELVEARNHAESLINTTEKTLSEHADKIGDDERSAIESDIEGLRAVVTGEDGEAINAKMEALTQSSMKLGEAMYKASQEEAAAGMDAAAAGADGSAPDDDETVVDVDFEEVDDDKQDDKPT
jgi:molecular chaperone DnaK